MNKNKKLVIVGSIVVALLMLVGAAYAYIQPSEAPPTAASTKTDTVSPANEGPNAYRSAESAALAKPDVITYDGNRFSPAILTVEKGATIQVINNSSKPMQFSSDTHPTHEDNPELNMEVLQPGKTGTFKVSKAGQHGYHDHLMEDNEGIVFVQ